MGKPYRFTGETAIEYPTIAGLGTVEPGAIGYFEWRAPDDRWELVEAQDDDGQDDDGDEDGSDEPPAELHRPALNASKADWQAYVEALGEPADAIEGKTTKELQARADELEAARDGGDGGAE